MAVDHRDLSSSIVAEAEKVSHVIKIDGYSITKGLRENGSCATSLPFKVAGHSWVVRYYPNGYRSEDAGYVSVYLFLQPPYASTTTKVILGFSLLDKDLTPVPSYSPKGPVPARTFSKQSPSWGHGRFIRKENLERSAHLRGDCFSIRCDVTVLKDIRVRENKVEFVVVPRSNLGRHLAGLLESMDGADVTFLVASQRFSAHRCVLAARSSVFKAELFGAMREKEAGGVVEIGDMEADVFGSLLHFIYTDSLPEVTIGNEESAVDDVAMAQHLLVAADRYHVERLKLMCEDRLCKNIDSTVVATSLVLAEQHGCPGLKEACVEFLDSASNFEAMLTSDGFNHLKNSCPSLLSELIRRFMPAELNAANKDIVMAI